MRYLKNIMNTTEGKKYLFSFLILYVFLFYSAFGQISHSGAPKINGLNSVPFYKLDGIDRDVLIASDKKERSLNNHKNLRFGKIIPVSLGVSNSGKIQELDETLIWRIGIWSPEAKGLGLVFNRFDLFQGDKVFIYSPDMMQILGAFTIDNLNEQKTLAVEPIYNDSIIIEYQFKKKRKDALNIGYVVYDYMGMGKKGNTKDEFYNTSGPCNIDVNCPEGINWQSEKKSVCRLFIYKPDMGYSELCSGVLLNNVAGTDNTYLLTSSHCVENSLHAENTIFVFGYESPYCDGPDGFISRSLSGSVVKALNDNLDFTLVELDEIPPITYNPIFAGWNISGSLPDNTVTIHHPNGDLKKISVDNDPAVVSSYSNFDNNAFWNILQWDKGTTEIGSSGSPLFDQDHRVIGILSGGDASCGNSVNDYFSRITNAWDDYSSNDKQLKAWLDPSNSGTTVIDQRDPYASVKQDCDTISNFSIAEVKALQNYINPDSGTITGHNSGMITKYAEKFINSSDKNITGVSLNIAKAAWSEGSDSVSINIWKGNDKPDQLIYEKQFHINNFLESAYNFIGFDSVINITTNFFAGYGINYDQGYSSSTQFAVYHAQDRGVGGTNTAFAFAGESWKSFPVIPDIGITTSIDLKPVICGEIPSLYSESAAGKIESEMVIFPNPAGNYATVKLSGFKRGRIQVLINDPAGRVLKSFYRDYNGGQFRIDLSGSSTGLYFVRLIQGQKTEMLKLTIIKH